MIYIVVLAGMYALQMMLKMHWITTVVMTLFLFLRIPHHRKLYQRSRGETLRFEETAEYLDTFLYAFVKEEKVERTLSNVVAALEEGPMRKLAEDALDHLHMTFDETDVMRESLRIVEKGYPCSRITAVHDFAVHVESYGGEVEKPVSLLLADKNRWEKRIRMSMAERKKMFTNVVLSIAASIIICGVILYLPVMNMDISGNTLSQILTAVVLILDDLIFSRAQKYLAVDWLSLELRDEKDDAEKIHGFYHYDQKKDLRLSVILTAVFLIAAIAAIYFGKKAWSAVAVLLSVLMSNQHRVGRSMAEKNIVKRVKRAFPSWLMDLVLLMQSENVQVSLMKSMEHVPGILEEDLQLLVDRLEMEPESAEPYHAFLREFHIPEVHSAMSMLYSISMGNSSRADQQMSELIDRNLKMLDVAATEHLRNLSSGMYLLFLAPVVTASMKLVVDMAVFMISFLAVTGVG